MTSNLPGPAHPPLRVVLASTQKTWGGGEAYLFALAQGLHSRGVQVHLMAPAESSLAKELARAIPEVCQFDASQKSPLAIWRMRRWMRSLGGAILHCNDSRALSRMGLAAAGLKSIRTVSMRHTMFPIRSPAKYHRLSRQVICVSHAVADACGTRGLSPDWATVIHSAIEPPHVADGEVRRLREELLPDPQHKLIVAVGNLFTCKGHQTLIEAAALLRDRGCDALTVIAGEGRQRAALELQIAERGLADHVKLLGFRDDANALLASADVVAHPAREEGLCLTVAAAMMLQKPIVATAAGGLCDVLGIDARMQAGGPFAAIAEIDDAQSLAEQLQSQLASPTDSQRLAAARDFAISRFTTQKMVDATMELYQGLVTGSTRSQAAA